VNAYRMISNNAALKLALRDDYPVTLLRLLAQSLRLTIDR
jgi:hypothetical protein